MADTGFKVTGTVESQNWTVAVTTTRINTSDDNRAQAYGSTYLVAELSDFNFGIPAGATIDGIELAAEYSSNASAYSAYLRISLSYDDGVNWTSTELHSNTGTTDSTDTYGGGTDLWDREWDDAELADGVFRVKIEGRGLLTLHRCRLDHLQIKVYYTEANGDVVKDIIGEGIVAFPRS